MYGESTYKGFSMNRNHSIMVRLTLPQKRQLKRRAEHWGMSVSELVRHLVLDRPPRPDTTTLEASANDN